MAMKILTLPIGQVKPYPGNPRLNKDAIAPVAESIRRFGFRQPIVVDEDYVVIAGHTRLEAARLLQMDKVPVHVAADLSPSEIAAYRIADNKTGEVSGWDTDALARELAAFDEAEFDWTHLGFSEEELESLTRQFSGGDDVEPPPEFPAFDESIETEHKCPKCGYEWSGKSS